MEDECMINMGDYKTFSPKVDLFTFDQKLRRINETLDITEINGRTGFTIEDKHLLLKDCYLCSEFRFPKSPSKIFLQTPLSACPCKLSKFKSRHWIGDISFETFLEAPNRVTRTLCMLRILRFKPVVPDKAKGICDQNKQSFCGKRYLLQNRHY
uniref:uncharacterized protein LOC104265958 n=1 Tax=Ciona intestinalis TaxID=7719 RepID=UPI000521C1C8|nr:uncharacterized protein LOC104265958 [Ciona intestinalis]|eukprot:XP_009859454.1 uncharacterized protein LOC104265958 [Ciona intestinalis]